MMIVIVGDILLALLELAVKDLSRVVNEAARIIPFISALIKQLSIARSRKIRTEIKSAK